jgi:predicted RNase H-like HicB family nuclease
MIASSMKFPNCLAALADGKTHQEALANVKVVIQEWIEIAKALGRRIPMRDKR